MDISEGKGFCYGLFPLVRDGVINQGQSDKITKRIHIIMKEIMY